MLKAKGKQNPGRDCKTQVLEGCINIAKMPEQDLQEHLNSQIKLAHFLGKKQRGPSAGAPIPPSSAGKPGGVGTPTSNSNPTQFKSFKLFHQGNQQLKQASGPAISNHKIQSHEKPAALANQASKTAEPLQSSGGKSAEPLAFLRSPQQDSFMNESLPECQLSSGRNEAPISQPNGNGTVPINRQSTYGGHSNSTRISGSPNQTVLQGSEQNIGNIKRIGLVPKEVKRAMKSQGTTAGPASVNQSFGVGGYGMSFASNGVVSPDLP